MNPRTRQTRRILPPAGAAIPWEDVLAHFSDAVVVVDRDMRIVLFNQAAEELTGRPQGRVLGQPCARVFSQAPQLGEMVGRVQKHGQSESRAEEHLVRGRRKTPVHVTCLPLWDDRDLVNGAALVIRDLSYQKTLEESTRRNESLASLGTLVAGLAHEVRNPLAGIRGAAQLLEGRLAQQPELAEYTAVITREATRLSALVEDLLTLGSPPRPRLAPLNIHRVIRHVTSLTEAEMRERGILLRCEFDPSLPDVQGDDAQLSQVFLNILRNAMDAMTADGAARSPRNTITICTRMETDFHILWGRDRPSKFLRVEVADRGVGIDPPDAARVFEPFYTSKPNGTGLGLAISQRIIAQHGGIIRIAPDQPDGTLVTVTLPVALR